MHVDVVTGRRLHRRSRAPRLREQEKEEEGGVDKPSRCSFAYSLARSRRRLNTVGVGGQKALARAKKKKREQGEERDGGKKREKRIKLIA